MYSSRLPRSPTHYSSACYVGYCHSYLRFESHKLENALQKKHRGESDIEAIKHSSVQLRFLVILAKIEKKQHKIRGTQQTASVNICSEDLSPPTSFELKCDEKLEYSLAQIFVAKISCNKVLDEIYRAFPGNDRLIPAKSISNAHTCIINTTVLHTIKAKMRYSNACDVTTRHIWNWRRLSGMYRRKGLALRANSIHCR